MTKKKENIENIENIENLEIQNLFNNDSLEELNDEDVVIENIEESEVEENGN